MSVFLDIARDSALVFTGLSVAAILFTLFGKFLTDISHDPDKEAH
jgi:hypothetical protein